MMSMTDTKDFCIFNIFISNETLLELIFIIKHLFLIFLIFFMLKLFLPTVKCSEIKSSYISLKLQ